jgi:hypothetical protein
MAGVRFMGKVRDFYLLHNSIQSLGPKKPFIQWVPAALSPRVKRPGRETEHSPSFIVEVKNGGALHLLLYKSSWRGA